MNRPDSVKTVNLTYHQVLLYKSLNDEGNACNMIMFFAERFTAEMELAYDSEKSRDDEYNEFNEKSAKNLVEKHISFLYN